MRLLFIVCAVALSPCLFAQTLPQTPPSLSARVEAIRSRLPDFNVGLKSLRDRGEDVAYPLVTYTVLDNFTRYAKDDLHISVPNGWGFVPVNGCDASFEPVSDAHTGQWAAKLVDRTPQKPNVYGMFENSNVVKLIAGKTYTISVWAKTTQPGGASLTLDASWSNRLDITETGGQWKRFAKTFTPAAADVSFGPRVLIQDVTDGVLLDDLSLVEGDQPETGKNLMPNGSMEESWTGSRVARELPDMEKMADRLDHQLADATANKIKLPTVPRRDGKVRPHIEGPSFLDSTGRPIFFVGYGHFKQVRDDIEKFPAYGINIVQHAEFGPREVFPKEDQTDNASIDRLINELDRASKAGVAIDFLISPHYVPDWLFTKYPHLRKTRADFFPYSIYAPEGRAIVKRFVDYVLPRIKDKPALLSICLSNEPINLQEPDEFSIKAWHEWLAKRHGDIATLNARWGSTYAKFDDVPQPNPIGKSAEPRPGPAWSDFCRWNGEYFAEFHKVFADYVHAAVPDIPVHAKATTWHLYRGDNAQDGDDATLLDNVTNINGNDSVNLWGFKQREGDLIERGTKDFAQGWRENALGYELQRSVHDAPVFNSENHFIFDRDARYVDPAHIRAGLWMGAIHGQSATTLWVWERELANPRSDNSGSIMECASCSEAVGIVDLDFVTAAREITAIQKAPAEVVILQNNSSAVWDHHRYDDCFIKLFTALSYTGLKIGFITERQLEEGKVADAPVLFVPDSVHLSAAAAKTLKNFKHTIVGVGSGWLLSRDEYDKSTSDPLKPTVAFTTDKTSWQHFLAALEPTLPQPTIQVLDAAGHRQSVVQWQIGRSGNAWIVNLYNSSHDPQTVRLSDPGTDVLNGDTIAAGQAIELARWKCGYFDVPQSNTDFRRRDRALAMTSSLRADAVWKVRDVNKRSKFTAPDANGEVPALKLKLEPHSDGERMSCVVIDETAGERAVTLSLCWPLDAIGGTWFDNPETSRKITAAATQPYANLSDRAGGVTDEASLYPIGVIAPPGSKVATVFACPADAPRMMRFVYDVTAKELRAEIDFGLSPIPKSYPSRADATVIQYEVPAKWAFRAALQKYYEKFPEAFARRVKTAGIWLPFGETAPIKDAADFGFAFHEIAEQQAIPRVLDDDQRIGCGSYLYIEPQTYWQNYKGKDSGTFEQRLAQLEADAKAGDRVSQATIVSGVVRSIGKRDLYMEGVPYTAQLPWGQDPDPNLPAGANGYPSKATYEFDRVEPHLGWRDKPNIGVDGIYIDSMEGWGELNDYDHDHWRAAQFPLTFDPMHHNHVALLNFWGVHDFIREMSHRLHKHGMILFGNDAFYRRWQLAPWVDVPGREYTWTDDAGKFLPIEEEHLLFLRSMAGKKPYLILMNNKYDDGSIMEPYFQRCLFYAIFPSAFSGQQSASDVNYFSNPAWYDRDRPLFKKYIPMVKKLDSAGWEPVPFATPLPSSVRIERYGSFDRGNLAFTIHNTDAAARDVMLQLDREALKINTPIEGNEWLSRQAIEPTIFRDTISLPIHLEANAYGVIGIQRRN